MCVCVCVCVCVCAEPPEQFTNKPSGGQQNVEKYKIEMLKNIS